MPDPAIWRRPGRDRPFRRSDPDRLSHPAVLDARAAALARAGRPAAPGTGTATATRLRDVGAGPRRPEEAVAGWDCARTGRPRHCTRRRRRWIPRWIWVGRRRWIWLMRWGGRS